MNEHPYTLQDLVFLRNAGVAIEADIFASAFEHENKHRNFSPCQDCGVLSMEQHALDCRRASILVLGDWFERMRAEAEAARWLWSAS